VTKKQNEKAKTDTNENSYLKKYFRERTRLVVKVSKSAKAKLKINEI